MKQMTKRFLCVLLAVMMLVSTGVLQLAEAAESVGQVETLKAAAVSQTKIQLKWSKVKKADGYCVYVYNTKKEAWTVKAYTAETTFNDKGLAAGTKYSYKVAAFVKDGKERLLGKMSPKAAAVTYPAAVTSLKAKAVTPVKVQLTWNAVTGAAGYVIYSKTGDADYKKAAIATGRTYTFTYKTAPGTVCYKVRPYLTSGDKLLYAPKFSPVAKLTVKPGPVTKLNVTTAKAVKVKLAWNAAVGATGYVIYAQVGDGAFKKLATTKERSYLITYPAAPGVVYYKVRAFAKVGNKNLFAEKFSPTVKIKEKPAKVDSITVSNISGTKATLKWAKSVGASEYIVYKKDIDVAGADSEFMKVATVKKNTYAVKYPASPRKVSYCVQASATVKGNTVLASMSAPVTFSMWPKGVTAVRLKKAERDSLTLEWSPADGASEYHVFQYVAVEGQEKKELQEIGVTKETSFVVEGLEPETAYSFRVRAVAVYETLVTETAISPVLTASTNFGTVKNATAVVNSNNTAVLSWNALEGATGFEVEKKVGDEWKKLGESLTTMFNISEKESDAKLAQGQTYYYRVRAFVKQGDEIAYSPYTDVIEVHSVPGKPEKAKAAAASDHAIVIDWPAVSGADCYRVQYYSKKGKWVDDVDLMEYHSYKAKDGKTRVYYADKNLTESGTYQYRVAAGVSNGGRLTFGTYGDPITFKYTYEPEPEKIYSDSFTQSGVAGYLYDPKEKVFYTSNDPWQRNFGFNRLYDFASQFVWIQYDTARFYFTYQGDDWMLQPWKGQYGIVLYGAELGVYKKYTERDAEHYDCAQDPDRLQMSMDFERYYQSEDGKSGEWKHEFYRPYGTYWWCTGFKPAMLIRLIQPFDANIVNEDITKQNYPELRANYRVTMKDFEMLEVFIDAMKETGFKQITYKPGIKPGRLQFAYHDLDVYFPF